MEDPRCPRCTDRMEGGFFRSASEPVSWISSQVLMATTSERAATFPRHRVPVPPVCGPRAEGTARSACRARDGGDLGDPEEVGSRVWPTDGSDPGRGSRPGAPTGDSCRPTSALVGDLRVGGRGRPPEPNSARPRSHPGRARGWAGGAGLGPGRARGWRAAPTARAKTSGRRLPGGAGSGVPADDGPGAPPDGPEVYGRDLGGGFDWSGAVDDSKEGSRTRSRSRGGV